MKVIRGGFGSRKTPSDRPRARAPAASSARPTRLACSRPCSARPAGTRAQAAVIVGTSAGSVTGAALAHRGARHGPGGIALRGADFTSRRGHPASHPPGRRRAPADAVGALAVATLESSFPRAHHPGRPAALGLPARRGSHDAAPPGSDRHLRAGPRPRRAHGQSLAGGTADLHGQALGRGPGRLRPGRARHRRAWPPPCWPRAPSPATSNRSTSGAPSTSTAACTRPPTPTCSGPRGSTWWSSSPPCRRPTAVPTGRTAGSGGPCTGAWNARSPGSRRPGSS